MKIRTRILALLMLLTSVGYSAQATEKYATQTLTEARAMQITQRVDDIRAMDFSQLNSTQRKDLRHELKGMNKELRQGPTYIYISGAALILIIILIILLL